MTKINIKYLIAIILIAFLAISGVFSRGSRCKCQAKCELGNIIVPQATLLRLEPSHNDCMKRIRACSDSKFARLNPGLDPKATRPDTMILHYIPQAECFPSCIKIKTAGADSQLDVMDVDVDTLSVVAHLGAQVRYRESHFAKVDTVGDRVFYEISPYIRTR